MNEKRKRSLELMWKYYGGAADDHKIVTRTTSGDIATFYTNLTRNLKSLIVNIAPLQSGSGDPSPTNVRPISGWTACVISHSGADMTNPTTYSIAFPSEAGTVYGGTLDVIKGTLTVDRAFLVVKNMAWARTTSYAHPVFYVNQNGKATSHEKGACSFLRNISRASIVSAQSFASLAENGDFALSAINSQIYVRYDDITDVNTFKTQFADEKFVYPLATPITYTLTPTEIRTLLGNNTLWADAGPVTVEYYKEV